MGWLNEAFDGTLMRLMPLTGRDVSPRRPGEPLPGTAGHAAMLMMLDDASRQMNEAGKGLYPRMPRSELLKLLDDMDQTDLPASVLDMQAEDATAYDHDTGRAWSLEGGNEMIRNEIEFLFNRLEIDSRLFPFCRNMIHYGSEFQRLVYAAGEGVTHLIDTFVRDMEISTDRDTREVRGYKEKGRTFKGRNDPISYPFDYVHFKLAGKRYEEPYGQSVLAAGIRPWTQMVLAEDKALLYRMTRHPDRLVFKIDVGAASEAEAWRTIQQYRRNMRKDVAVDPSLGKMYANYSPLGALEDIWLGVRPQSVSDVNLLQGSANVQDVTDLSHWARKLLVATRTPPPLFGFDDPKGQAEQFLRNKKLANQDIRYARHILRIQRALVEALLFLCAVHLRLKAQDPESPLLDYAGDPDTGTGALKIKLQPPSFLHELERLELLQVRAQIATEMLALGQQSDAIVTYEWTLWVFKHVLRMKDEILNRLVQEPQAPTVDAMGNVQPGGRAGTPRPQLAPPDIMAQQKQALVQQQQDKSDQKPGQPRPKKKPGQQNASYNGHGNGVVLHDSRMFGYTNGGDISEEDQNKLLGIIRRSPSLRNRLARLMELQEARRDLD